MEVKVYADVLFIINFIINLILLKISSLFIKNPASVLRLTLASALGSIYAVCMFFPDISFLYIIPFKIFVSVIMIKIICPKSKIFKIIKHTAVFYMVSFTFAGVLLSLIYLGNISQKTTPVIQNGIFYFDISLGAVCIAALICYAVTGASSAIFKRNKTLGIKNLKIVLSDKVCELAALSDTGNLLKDPITGTPVVIAEKNHLSKLFPDGMPDIDSITDSDVKMRLIPYSSLGNEAGIMTGFIPDEIAIDGRVITDVIVAASEGTLSKKDEYNALFNPDILYNRR
ncbi:MAG: sigma-E processing peptidase SpoIIGA [Clostridia bacterium]|nr:sigma-E processing peptidase SpoIIGA [Clostridia bacterium]